MKQQKTLIALLLTMGLFPAGCLTIHESAAFSEERVRTVSFKGNPTAGYLWTYEIENPRIVSVEEETAYRGDSDFVGAPTDFIYTFRPLSEGMTVVSFYYARPWEETPSEIRRFNAVVDKNGNLTLTGEAAEQPESVKAKTED